MWNGPLKNIAEWPVNNTFYFVAASKLMTRYTMYSNSKFSCFFFQIQEIESDPGTVLTEYITTINNCYPEEIVR